MFLQEIFLVNLVFWVILARQLPEVLISSTLNFIINLNIDNKIIKKLIKPKNLIISWMYGFNLPCAPEEFFVNVKSQGERSNFLVPIFMVSFVMFGWSVFLVYGYAVGNLIYMVNGAVMMVTTLLIFRWIYLYPRNRYKDLVLSQNA